MKAKAKYLWVAHTGRKQKGGEERRGEQRWGEIFNDKKWNMDQEGVGEGAKYEQNVKNSLLIKMRTVKQLQVQGYQKILHTNMREVRTP